MKHVVTTFTFVVCLTALVESNSANASIKCDDKAVKKTVEELAIDSLTQQSKQYNIPYSSIPVFIDLENINITNSNLKIATQTAIECTSDLSISYKISRIMDSNYINIPYISYEDLGKKNRIEDEIERIKTERGNMFRNLEQYAEQIENKERSIEYHTEELANLRKEREKKQEKVKNLEAKIRSGEGTFTSFLKTYRSDVEDVESRIEERKDKILDIEGEVRELTDLQIGIQEDFEDDDSDVVISNLLDRLEMLKQWHFNGHRVANESPLFNSLMELQEFDMAKPSQPKRSEYESFEEFDAAFIAYERNLELRPKKREILIDTLSDVYPLYKFVSNSVSIEYEIGITTGDKVYVKLAPISLKLLLVDG